MKRIIEINLVLGVWLIVAPFVLAYSRGHIVAMSNDVVLGLLLVASSLWALAERSGHIGVAAFEAACGVWLMLEPFMLHGRTAPHAFFNNVAVGGIVVIVSLTDTWMLAHRARQAASSRDLVR
jgi:hypothetical protein